MKKLEKILTDIKQESHLKYLFENGYTIEQVKNELITTLAPYFKNQHELEKSAVTFLVADWVYFLRLQVKFPGIDKDIASVIKHYNKAKITDAHQVFSVINNLLPAQIDNGNKFWSILSLEPDKSTLDFEDFVQSCLTSLVDIVEGLSKLYLIENLAIDRINRGKIVDIEKIKTLDLGVIVDELANNSPFPHIFKLPPENLRLSDWRNIGAHLNYKLQSGKVICEYGSANNRKSITLTRDELFEGLMKCVKSLDVMNISHKFFAFDNFTDIKNANPLSSNTDARIEIGFLMFTSGAMSQGFEVVEINIEKDTDALVVLKDLTLEDPLKRSIHASQLIYTLWTISKCKNLTIEYQEKSGELYLKATVTDDICKQIFAKEKDIDYLADNLNMDFVKLNLSL